MLSLLASKNDNGEYDISFNSNGQFNTISGVEAIAQNCTTAILLVVGEWFLNTGLGVDYYGTVFRKGASKNAIDQEFIDAINSVVDVTQVVYYSSVYDYTQRKLIINFNAQTTLGNTGTVEVQV